MELRPFGSTGRQVTPLGLGLAALGRPGYITLDHADDLNADYDVAAMQAHTHSVLDAAYAAGIRYFDAARSYGRAEAFLGNWLRARTFAHDAVTVGSKWGYTYTADWQIDAENHEIKEHSLAVLQRQWSETQAELGGYLDLYQIHSAKLETGVLDAVDVLNELARLKGAGTAIGLTLSGPGQAETLRKALTVQIDNQPLFDTVQITWNILEPSTSSVLNEAHARGMAVIVKETLANGRLTPRNRDPKAHEILAAQAARLNTTIDALALAAVLAQPWATVILSGAARVEHLESNVKALDVIWDDEAAEAVKPLIESPELYWSKRSALAWN